MKKVLLSLAIIFVLTGFANVKASASDDKKNATHALSINIPTHAMVAIVGSSTDVTFQAQAAVTVGDKVTFNQTSTSQLWLNYSSIVNGGNSNTISAKVSELPEGMTIDVAVSNSAASGKKGHTGKGYTKTLTTGGVQVVDNIKSCFTGSGESLGHSLDYSVNVDETNYDKIVAATHNLTITYTITEK